MELEERDGLNMFLTRLGKKHVFFEYSNEKENFPNILFFNFVQDTF